MGWNAPSVFRRFLRKYIECTTRKSAKFDLLLRNRIGQVTVDEHFGASNHRSIHFKIVMDDDQDGP